MFSTLKCDHLLVNRTAGKHFIIKYNHSKALEVDSLGLNTFLS